MTKPAKNVYSAISPITSREYGRTSHRTYAYAVIGTDSVEKTAARLRGRIDLVKRYIANGSWKATDRVMADIENEEAKIAVRWQSEGVTYSATRELAEKQAAKMRKVWEIVTVVETTIAAR